MTILSPMVLGSEAARALRRHIHTIHAKKGVKPASVAIDPKAWGPLVVYFECIGPPTQPIHRLTEVVFMGVDVFEGKTGDWAPEVDL